MLTLFLTAEGSLNVISVGLYYCFKCQWVDRFRMSPKVDFFERCKCFKKKNKPSTDKVT